MQFMFLLDISLYSAVTFSIKVPLCYNLEWSVLACFILKGSHHEESNMND